MHAPNRAIWLKIGTWPAFCAALLPVAVALLHLMPAIMAGPAVSHDHHEHAAAADEMAVARHDDHHPSRGPSDGLPQKPGAHCPLCLWLQGFHVLPAPLAAALPMPAARPFPVQWHAQTVEHPSLPTSSQPRAPPISPAV